MMPAIPERSCLRWMLDSRLHLYICVYTSRNTGVDTYIPTYSPLFMQLFADILFVCRVSMSMNATCNIYI